MPDLGAALQNDKSLRAQLLGLYPELADDSATLLDTLEGLSDLDEQCAAVIRQALEREAMGDAIGAMIKELQARKGRLEDGAKKMRAAVLAVLLESGRTRIGNTPAIPDMTVSVSPGRARAVVTDVMALPRRLYVVERKPIMAEISKALAAGENVPGAAIGNPIPHLTVRRS